MKTKLLAVLLSAVAVPVSASSVDIYGRVTVFQSSEDVAGAGSTHKLVNDASRIGFRATEDLGNGITIRAVIETGINFDEPTAPEKETKLGDRESSLSVLGAWGSIGVGRKTHPWAAAFDTYTALGRDYGSFDNAITSTYGTRFSNATFGSVTLGPVTLSGAYSASEARIDDSTLNGGTSFTAETKLGQFSAIYGYHQTVENVAGQDQSHMLGFRYAHTNKGKTTVGALVTDDSFVTTNSNSWQVFGSHYVTENLQVAVGYGENDNDASGTAVRGTYFMSKRTRLMALYSDANYTSKKRDTEIIAVGIRHDF